MKSIVRLVPVVAFAMVATVGHAQVAVPAAPSTAPNAAAAPSTASPAKKALVKRALQAQQAGIESLGTGLANQTAGQLMQMAGPAIARAPEDKRRALVNDLQTDVRKFQGEVAPILRASAVKWAPSTLGTALEEKLTEEELKVLLAWLESPVSRKYVQISGEAQQALTQKVVNETRPQVEPKLQALEQAMLARLNPAPGAPAAPPASGPRLPESPAKK